MEPMTVDMALITRLAFDEVMRNFVRQTSASYKGRDETKLVLQADAADDLPFILLKRVGAWMAYSRFLVGSHDEFRGAVNLEVDGEAHQVMIEATKTTLTLKRIGRA